MLRKLPDRLVPQQRTAPKKTLTASKDDPASAGPEDADLAPMPVPEAAQVEIHNIEFGGRGESGATQTPARPSTRPIHLKPVSVSSWGWPAAVAILPSRLEETIELA